MRFERQLVDFVIDTEYDQLPPAAVEALTEKILTHSRSGAARTPAEVVAA